VTDNNYLDQVDEEGIRWLDVLQTLSENARLLFFGPIVFALVIWGLSWLVPPKYEATTAILPPQQQSQGMAAAALAQLSAMTGMGGGGTSAGGQAAMYIGLLKSRTVADRLVDRFGLMRMKEVKTREDAREVLERVTRVVQGRDGIISISVISKIPKLSSDMANAYVHELTVLSDRLAITEAQERRVFLEKELAKAKDGLTKAEVALGESGISEGALKFNPAVLGQGLATLKAQIMAKELQLASMRGYLSENNMDYRLAREELAALRAQMTKFERAEPSEANAEYVQRYRDFKYHEVLFEQLAKQLELAKLDELREGPLVQVVDVAVPPERKTNLHKAIIALIAWLVAGIVLAGYVFVRHTFKASGQNPEDAEKVAVIRAGFLRVIKPWQRRRPMAR